MYGIFGKQSYDFNATCNEISEKINDGLIEYTGVVFENVGTVNNTYGIEIEVMGLRQNMQII